MANLNKIMLIGNLTRDPELSYLPSNMPVCRISIATNHQYKRQDGEQVEEVMFIDCTAFARRAEVLNQYMKKGRPIFIEGRLKLDRWQDKDGNNRSKHEVMIDNFQFLGGRDDDNSGGGGGGGGGGNYNSGGQSNSYNNRNDSNQGRAPQQSAPPEMDSDDVPF